MKPGQTDRFRFGSVFLGPKSVQIGLTWFFRFGLILAQLGSIFSGFARFFQFGSVFSGLARFFQFGSVFSGLARFWFGFFGLARFFAGLARFFDSFFMFGFGSVCFFLCFRLIKLKPNRTGWFFQNFNRFFFTIWFFRFFGSFAHP